MARELEEGLVSVAVAVPDEFASAVLTLSPVRSVMDASIQDKPGRGN